MARTDTLGHFLTDVADAIREKKGTSETIQASDFDTEIENLPSGGVSEPEEKEVNFYDYDGTRVYSYIPQEFLALESMPANPSHAGLTAQGWNWSLADAQEYVEDYGICDIGQMYITNDGATRIYIELADRTSPYLKICVDGTVTVDWGDNTQTDTIVGSSTTDIIATQHVYSASGKYIISILPTENTNIAFSSYDSSHCALLNASESSGDRYYPNCIKKIELGTGITNIDSNSFVNCNLLKYVTMPMNITSISNNAFGYCYSLINIIIPDGMTAISGDCFRYCYNLSLCILPATTTSTSNAINSCYNLKKIVIPPNMTSMSLASCYGIRKLIIPNKLQNAFNSLYAEKIDYYYTALPYNGFTGNYVMKTFIMHSVRGIVPYGCFNGCYSLTSLSFPNNITSINQLAFNNCTSMKYYDFSNNTSIPSLNTTAFTGIPSDCKIIVPDNLYENWIAATNWSTYASYIISKSDWDAL